MQLNKKITLTNEDKSDDKKFIEKNLKCYDLGSKLFFCKVLQEEYNLSSYFCKFVLLFIIVFEFSNFSIDSLLIDSSFEMASSGGCINTKQCASEKLTPCDSRLDLSVSKVSIVFKRTNSSDVIKRHTVW